jgi:ABC-type uncharacterized transport system involved in gliding motility auxiliary subunit
MTKRQTNILTFLSLASVVLAVLLSQRLWIRFDLTRDKAYTISEVSRNLYTEIPDQVRITYYISDRLRSVDPMPGEIEDLIREYAAHSHGKIRFFSRDPAKANLEEQVEQMGVQPQSFEMTEKDQTSFAMVYTGIVIEYLDAIEVLPVVFSLDTLEYDLTSRIRSLVRGNERQAGIIVGDSYRQWNEDYGYVNAALVQAGYTVRLINPGDEIPDVLPVLVVLGGAEELDEWDLYRIDRYIQSGGKVLFALEGIYVNSRGNLEARPLRDQGLLEMTAFYGVRIKPELVLDQAANTLQYQTRSPTGAVQLRMLRYPHWIRVLDTNGNEAHPVSARFAGVDLYWPSPLEIRNQEGVEAAPLFTTTGEAWIMDNNFATSPEASYLFEENAEGTRGKKILAAALSGNIPSWFRGRLKPQRDGVEELPDLPPEGRASRVVVIGDTDIVSGFMRYTDGVQRNLDFFLKALDWLGSDDDILGIRNRQRWGGRLDRIADPAVKARALRFVRILNLVIVPLAVIALGLFLAWKRRRSHGV